MVPVEAKIRLSLGDMTAVVVNKDTQVFVMHVIVRP